MIIRMANNFDPDYAQHFVGPNLDQNCLQKLSVDDAIGKKLQLIVAIRYLAG